MARLLHCGLTGFVRMDLQQLGSSLFSMALFHWTFGLFWSLWPQDNLQKAVPFYRPQIAAVTALLYVLVVVYMWGPQTLTRFRFVRHRQVDAVDAASRSTWR